MRADISAVEVVRVARALGDAPDAAYTTPIVYPWATQNFVARPQAPRPQPPAEPLRLYVHVPFCRYHCTFCFYAVRTGAKRQEMERYVAALERELRSFGPGPSLSRLTVGGGTPTALPPDLLEHALAAISEHVPAAAKHESTLEASPDSLAAAHIRVLRRYGIGRVSIGIESTNETILGAVHR